MNQNYCHTNINSICLCDCHKLMGTTAAYQCWCQCNSKLSSPILNVEITNSVSEEIKKLNNRMDDLTRIVDKIYDQLILLRFKNIS